MICGEADDGAQVKSVPGVVELSVTVTVWPEQADGLDGENDTPAEGCTVTVNIVISPVHPFDSGVTEYVIVPGKLLLFTSIWLIESPDPLLYPEIPAETGPVVQENVVGDMLD